VRATLPGLLHVLTTSAGDVDVDVMGLADVGGAVDALVDATAGASEAAVDATVGAADVVVDGDDDGEAVLDGDDDGDDVLAQPTASTASGTTRTRAMFTSGQ